MSARLLCWVLGHRFFWLDVNRRHHCARCGALDEDAVRFNRLLRMVNRRAGCDCPTCILPAETPERGESA